MTDEWQIIGTSVSEHKLDVIMEEVEEKKEELEELKHSSSLERKEEYKHDESMERKDQIHDESMEFLLKNNRKRSLSLEGMEEMNIISEPQSKRRKIEYQRLNTNRHLTNQRSITKNTIKIYLGFLLFMFIILFFSIYSAVKIIETSSDINFPLSNFTNGRNVLGIIPNDFPVQRN